MSLADQIKDCSDAVTDYTQDDWTIMSTGLMLKKIADSDVQSHIEAKDPSTSDVAWEILYDARMCELLSVDWTSTMITDLKTALTNADMHAAYKLPKSDSGNPTQAPMQAHYYAAYRYARELNKEQAKFDIEDAFKGWKACRDAYNKQMAYLLPATPTGYDINNGRWWTLSADIWTLLSLWEWGAPQLAFQYALMEWEGLQDRHWSTDHYIYAPALPNWEMYGYYTYSAATKLLRLNGGRLPYYERIFSDMQNRYLANKYSSHQWRLSGGYGIEHHYDATKKINMGGQTLWSKVMHTFFGMFSSANKSNLQDMIEGTGGLDKMWVELTDSVVFDSANDEFYHQEGDASTSDKGTCEGIVCLFFEGISPRTGRGLAIPMDAEFPRRVDAKHFQFDYTNKKIRIAVWGGSTLRFLFGTSTVDQTFDYTGIYDVTFAANWNSITSVDYVRGLHEDKVYLYELDEVIDRYQDGWIVFDSDMNKLVRSMSGNGVVTGLKVVESSGMNVKVQLGTARLLGIPLTVDSAQTVSITAADASYPRKDIIILNLNGSLSTVDGTPEVASPSGTSGPSANQPKPPNFPTNTVLLAEVWVPANATSISSDDIVDRRVRAQVLRYRHYDVYKTHV